MIVSVVPDTNVFIQNLELLKAIFRDTWPIDLKLYIPTIVLRELDYQKDHNLDARVAIKYLTSISETLFSRLEDAQNYDVGATIENKTEKFVISNNDDKILGALCKVENPILLTYDQVFYLKALSLKFKCIYLKALMYTEVKAAILRKYTKIELMDICEDADNVMLLLDDAKNLILPDILHIMNEKLGPGYIVFFPDVEKMTLADLVNLIVKEFSVFTSVLPKSSRKFLKELAVNLKSKDQKNINHGVRKLLVLFRKV